MYNLIYWTSMSSSYFCTGSNLKNVEIFLKTDKARLGKYHTGRYGRIGVYRDNF